MMNKYPNLSHALKSLGVFIIAVIIGIFLACLTGCARTLIPMDDGTYYCVSDSKYYNEYTKFQCLEE